MKTLLKNGTIVDGSGGKPYVSDVLIENDKITKIAKDIDAADAEVIDCTGLTVAPGFIDAHSHNDFFYDYDDAERFYEPFIRQGITTQITGNCGFSPFGVDKNTKYKDKVGGGLFHAKNPGSFKDFIKNAEGKLYVNIVPLIGHGTTRISISGFDAKPLTKEQIDEEMKLVDEAMENGAFGGSFGFMYEPGMYSKTDELVAFATELQKYDGILTIHPRAESKVAMGYPLISKPHIEIALDEIIDIMEKSKVRTEYSHLIFVGRSSWPSVEPMLKKLHDYNEKGYKIAYDNYAFSGAVGFDLHACRRIAFPANINRVSAPCAQTAHTALSPYVGNCRQNFDNAVMALQKHLAYSGKDTEIPVNLERICT